MISFGKPIPVQETKAHKDHWSVSGYLSTYGNVDFGNDIVEPGAFDRWMTEGNKTRFLYSHRPDKVLGIFEELRSDGKGLFARARISQTALGEEVYTLVKDGAVDSFSIGYITRDSERKEGNRHLKDLDLPESSLVSIPMNPQAMVTAVKDWMALLDLEYGGDTTIVEKMRALSEGMGLLLEDLTGLVDGIDRPISNVKREELKTLLSLCDELGAVRSGLDKVLTPSEMKKTSVVDARYVMYQLRQRRAQYIGD